MFVEQIYTTAESAFSALDRSLFGRLLIYLAPFSYSHFCDHKYSFDVTSDHMPHIPAMDKVIRALKKQRSTTVNAKRPLHRRVFTPQDIEGLVSGQGKLHEEYEELIKFRFMIFAVQGALYYFETIALTFMIKDLLLQIPSIQIKTNLLETLQSESMDAFTYRLMGVLLVGVSAFLLRRYTAESLIILSRVRAFKQEYSQEIRALVLEKSEDVSGN